MLGWAAFLAWAGTAALVVAVVTHFVADWIVVEHVSTLAGDLDAQFSLLDRKEDISCSFALAAMLVTIIAFAAVAFVFRRHRSRTQVCT
jgi:hypothetical protein